MEKSDELLKKYMELPYTMNIIPDKEEGGYTVYFPDLPGGATCVESLDEVKEMAEDAKRELTMNLRVVKRKR